MQNYDAASDKKRKREIIDSRICLMAGAGDEHIDVQDNLNTIFNIYFNQSGRKCRARNDSDLIIDKNNIFKPDLKVLCRDNGDIPVIVIEVSSKSTRDRDLGVKMKKYAEFGIKEYWIITWEARAADIYLLSEDRIYRHYKSYALFADDDKIEIDEETDIINEFSPVSFPELKIKLADVFNIWI